MNNQTFRAAPVLASMNMRRTLDFYRDKLNFRITYDDPHYGIIVREDLIIHFWKCDSKLFPENTSCYVYVRSDVEQLYHEMSDAGVIHPNGKLQDTPWGMREFSILDCEGNLIRWGQSLN